MGMNEQMTEKLDEGINKWMNERIAIQMNTTKIISWCNQVFNQSLSQMIE